MNSNCFSKQSQSSFGADGEIAPPSFRVGINRKIVGKCDPQKLSYAGAFQDVRLKPTELVEHIKRGNPWMVAVLDRGKKRLQQYANYAELSALDIDDGMTISDAIAHPFISKYCLFGIESASSTDQHNKFRLVFRLPRPVEGWQTIRICNQYLAEIVGSADPACKDASRYFFGAPGREPFLLSELACLPASFVEDAIAWHKAIEVENKRRAEIARQQWQQWKEQHSEQDAESLVLSALEAIDSDQDYNDWIAIGMALAGMGDFWFTAWDTWSARGSKYKLGECDRKWKSFRGKAPAPETIFGIAKRYGWKFPKRERSWLPFQRCKRPKPVKRKPAYDALYTPGARVPTWKKAQEQGYRIVLDQSGTGEGKSFDTGNAEPKDFGVAQLIYATDQQRNPTTNTLSKENGWSNLEARHGGLVRELTANGGSRLRRAKKGEAYSVAPNCNRTGLINALRAKNVSGADTAAIVCGGCPLKGACTHAEGRGYGFLYQRKNAIPAQKLRAHPDSLPEPSDYDFGRSAIIWDEAGQNFNFQQQIQVKEGDIVTTIGKLAIADSAQFDLLKPLLETLQNLVQAKHGRYGLNHADVLAQLPTMPDEVDALAIERSLQPDFDFLNTTAEYGVNLDELPPSVQKRFTDSDAESAKTAAENIDQQWLPELLRVLKGQQRGAVHVGHVLTIWYADNRHRAIAQSAAFNVFLDATLSREQLALMLGCDPSEIFVCAQQSEPTTNLEVGQVADLGRMGMQRGKHQQKRAEAIAAHYKSADPATSVIEFKKHDGDGAWWRDSRGVNDFLEINTLILVGTPCPNLADLMARFAILTGDSPSEENEGFQRFVDETIEAEFIQAIGRLRANRRRDKQLRCVIISDFELSIPTRQIAAKDITIEAASKSERSEQLIRDAVAQLKSAGQKVTQVAVSAITGLSQGYVSRFRKLLQTLLGTTNSKSNNSGLDELTPVIESAITDSDGLQQTAEVIDEIFHQWVATDTDQSALFDRLTHCTQAKILGALMAFNPQQELEVVT